MRREVRRLLIGNRGQARSYNRTSGDSNYAIAAAGGLTYGELRWVISRFPRGESFFTLAVWYPPWSRRCFS